jgi:hypothetical protein
MILKENKWQKNIIHVLELADFKPSNYFESVESFKELANNEDSGKQFMEQIAQQKRVYEYLDNLSLVNTGICPITGQKMGDKNSGPFNFTIFGRTIFLSREGKEICENLKRKSIEKQTGLNYDAVRKIERIRGRNYKFYNLFIIVLSLAIPYYIVKPNSFWSFLLFIILFLVTSVLIQVFMTKTGLRTRILFDKYYSKEKHEKL